MPLVDVTHENGALRMISGSHMQGYVQHQFYPDMNNYHGIIPEMLDESNIEYAMLKRGDAVLFDSRLFHGSTPNRTPRIRWTFIARYNPIRSIPYLESEEAPMRIEQVEF